LGDIHYVKMVKIGDEALEEGLKKAAATGDSKKNAKTPPAKIKKRDDGKQRAKI